MASVGFGTTVAPAPAAASPSVTAGRRLMSLRPSSARVARPSATKSGVAAAATQEKGLFETIFGALYKEEQLLETDPVLNKVEGKATKAAGAKTKKATGDGEGGGFSFGGPFFKEE
ncbi:hypothetical protein GUJ93_ZPchr0007g3754 [Zizania palustris]|uniref:Uncharacterized protein n=1 Tax=Zizania palustris TaxID=103762 RepID=A0A8J5W5E4_ZIZPA|nr:hypothetical protein GUJ93_ZPchr0007g3754 [Zizania palustris]